jgi:hypothetical protein
MRVTVEFDLDIDAAVWAVEYGVAPDAVPEDVLAYLDPNAIAEHAVETHLFGPVPKVAVSIVDHSADEYLIDILTDDMLAYDVGPKFSCIEVNALADFLRAHGQPQIADMWIRAHAADDDEGDQHFRMGGDQDAATASAADDGA